MLIDLEYCFTEDFAAKETNSNELAETIQTATFLWAHRDFAGGGIFVTSNSTWYHTKLPDDDGRRASFVSHDIRRCVPSGAEDAEADLQALHLTEKAPEASK